MGEVERPDKDTVRQVQVPEKMGIGRFGWRVKKGYGWGRLHRVAYESIHPPQPIDVALAASTPTCDKRRSRTVLPQLEMEKGPC